MSGANAYYLRGSAYYDIGEDNLAILDFTKALERNPKYASAYNSRGDVYYKKGDYAGARADYERALKVDPDYTSARKNLEKLKNEGR